MSNSFEELPTLGVGASLSLSSDPDPVSLVKAKGGPSFVEYSGIVDVDAVIDEVEKIRAAGAQVLFHPSYINFCGSFPNSNTWLETTSKHIETVASPWFAQDVAYCFWEEGPGYSTQLGYFIPLIFNQHSLALAVERVKEVQAKVPVPVAIEPPPVAFVIGSIPLFSFFGSLAKQTDCAILLDMGHLVSYEMASGRSVLDAIDELPCERVVEVHIAGGRLKEGEAGPIYVDAHECTIVEQTWLMFEAMLPLLPNVKAVCYECEGVNESTVLATLEHIRKIVRDKSASDTLVASLDGGA
ncbi:MAG TPA: DUF692 family protein [Thiotrichaceae bacterium]|jgi:uncharacterized protein (UPF0276 family)|nr:DUF692 family protein [Thiotrichaceae bacterium]HIM07207.1 DUF692 family protein [Gammaproteobacteria bacterium]